MSLCRRENWATLLSDFLLMRQGEPFRYGRFDCCLFVCDAIAVMTGEDIAGRFRGRYQSRVSARQLLKAEYGEVSVAAAVVETMARHELQEIPVPFAGRGDAVLVRRVTRGHLLGLLGLDGASVLMATEQGWASVPVGAVAVERAWRI